MKKLCLVLRGLPLKTLTYKTLIWAYSSAGLERTPDKREVDGSSPFRPIWGISSAGRAPALQAGGHRFDSVILHYQPEG